VKPRGAPAGILLAAGYAQRFGADKLLVNLPNGRSIALTSALSLLGGLASRRVVAVVRPEQQALAVTLAASGVEIAFCMDAAQGMARSLAAGVAYCGQRWPDACGWVVALADMPFMQDGTVRAVAQALQRGAALSAPLYGGERGHPVGIAAEFRDELLSQNGDAGARRLLARENARLVTVATDDPGILRDVDVPHDLALA